MGLSEKEFNKMMKGSHAKIKDSVAFSPSDMEQNTVNEASGKNEVKTFDSQVNITVHQFRHRLCDPDGASCKWVLDEIVNSGILQDDRQENISEIRFRQTKIKKPELERTEIEVIKT